MIKRIEKNLGVFKTSGKIRVTDPCYSVFTDDITVLDVKPGTWHAKMFTISTGMFGRRVQEVLIYHENHSGAEPAEEMYNAVSVDSGQAGFFDDERYPKAADTGDIQDEESFYAKCCAATMVRPFGGIIEDIGAVVSSGYGDGLYTLNYSKDKDQIVVLSIMFIDTFDNDNVEDQY